MYEKRPKIDMPKTMLSKFTNIIGYSLFFASIAISMIYLPTLPDTVPIHFNIAGEADNWGSKYFILFLPIIGIIMSLPMEALERNPQMHNYPTSFNVENARDFYAISIRTMNLVKNGSLILFALIQIEILLSAMENSFSFGPFIIVFIILMVFVPIVWHLISIKQIKNNQTE